MEINTVSLKNYSSLRVGGEGKMVVVTTTIELVETLMYAKQTSKHVHIIGEGTNTFFGDDLSRILFIKMEIKGISLEEFGNNECIVTAYAGENWDDLVKMSVEKNLWGIENLSAIPGTVGATPVQNIGAYGVELRDVLVSVSAIDTSTFDLVEISNEACLFGYRDSRFKQEKGRYIIVSVTLQLSKQACPVLTYKPLNSLVTKEDLVISEVQDLVVATRKAKLPDYIKFPNTGSFFKNCVVSSSQAEGLRTQYPDIKLIEHGEGYKIPAAWLIEHVAEAKGLRVGDVGTWPDQPLVLVNYGEASAADVIHFSQKIITSIHEVTGLTLEREVNFVH